MFFRLTEVSLSLITGAMFLSFMLVYSSEYPGFMSQIYWSGVALNLHGSWRHSWVEHATNSMGKNYEFGMDFGFSPIFVEPGNGKSQKHRLLITISFICLAHFHNHPRFPHRSLHHCTIPSKFHSIYRDFSWSRSISRGYPASFQIARACPWQVGWYTVAWTSFGCLVLSHGKRTAEKSAELVVGWSRGNFTELSKLPKIGVS